MLDLENEDVISISEAARSMPGGRVHPSTIFRWATKGCSGTVLETARSGGKRVTTRQAVRRFNERLTAGNSATAHQPVNHHNADARQRSLAQAERELQAAGI